MRYWTFAATIAILSALTGVGHAADGLDDGVAKRLFAGKAGKPKSYACFVRRYDGEHLARHPRQKVTTMKLLVTAEKLPEDDRINFSFQVGVRLRHQAGTFDSAGSCGHVETSKDAGGQVQFQCAVECDGGGVTVKLPEHGKSVTLELASIRLWKHSSAGDEGDHELEAGADDGVFRLDRASLDDCRSLVVDKDELAELRRQSASR
jgi:hypothetical protein